MKLLSPQAVKDSKNQEITRDIIRAKEVGEVVRSTNYQLAKSQADFSLMLARNKEQWANEEEAHDKRVREMTSEITDLENKRKQALIPLQIEEERAYNLMKEAKEALIIVAGKQERLDETQELLEKRLDDVAERALILSEQERASQGRLDGINAQSEHIKEQNRLLTKAITEFEQYKSEQEVSLYERKKDVSLLEINLNAKMGMIKRGEESLRVERIKLNDMRATLERAMARTKK